MSGSMSQKRHLDVTHSALNTMDLSKSLPELRQSVMQTLENKIHGICFSIYKDDQDPAKNSQITEQQIRDRLAIIQPYAAWIRIFSCTCGHEKIPRIAHEMGFKTLVGAWLDADLEANEEEIKGLIDLASKGFVDLAAVGNEVIYRGDLPEDKLIGYLTRVKEQIPRIPVGYVDSYYIFRDHPKVAAACDLVMANCYPYWESCALGQSIEYMREMYHTAIRAANGKKVIISETGWPSDGGHRGDAVASLENMAHYFVNTYRWAKEEAVDIFYFTSFDEHWKAQQEGDCGAHWGLWTSTGDFKFT